MAECAKAAIPKRIHAARLAQGERVTEAHRDRADAHGLQRRDQRGHSEPSDASTVEHSRLRPSGPSVVVPSGLSVVLVAMNWPGAGAPREEIARSPVTTEPSEIRLPRTCAWASARGWGLALGGWD